MADTRRSLVCFALVAALLALLMPAFSTRAQTTSAEPFAAHYWQHRGQLTLGSVHTPAMSINGVQMQFFERARLEDHRHLTDDPARAVAYSPLTVELINAAPDIPVAGLPITYGELRERGAAQHPAPAGLQWGTTGVEQGVFVPANQELVAGPGYIVPHQFWTYLNRASLFPGGWRHAAGLPLTNAFDIMVPAEDGTQRHLIIQAFERTVLALDLSERYEWSVERLTIGTDAAWVYGVQPAHMPHTPPPPEMQQPAGPKRIEVSLESQWLYAYEGDQLVLDAPASTGKDGFETPPGAFSIYAKYPQKTLRGSYNGETWDVPDVPSVMFYRGGFAIHGVYWHDRFGTGERHSHGCVGVAPHDAAAIYAWAGYGTPIIVR